LFKTWLSFSPFGVRYSPASAHTDCLIKLLKSGGNRQVLPGCEAAYLTLFASGVKRLLSLFSDFPPRHVSAQRRSVVAHYREFSAADKSFFQKKLLLAALHSKTPVYTILHTKLSTI
ncbi:hypothetical protein, partial [Xenorhabdus koppenhoeferi]|uniref:hypothetical protein n=1 Tax=Xenorhabdus koppenhoeferi TaxID=351659 RepID=UPI001C4352BE